MMMYMSNIYLIIFLGNWLYTYEDCSRCEQFASTVWIVGSIMHEINMCREVKMIEKASKRTVTIVKMFALNHDAKQENTKSRKYLKQNKNHV